MDTQWFVLAINPQPWVVPPFSPGRKEGKVFMRAGRDEGLYAYQQAVRDEISLLNPVMLDPPYRLRFWFWRETPAYTTPRQQEQRKHDADLTNMQKALEDALQGILFENDRDVRQITSEIVDQGSHTLPTIVIKAESGYTWNTRDLPEDVFWKLTNAHSQPQREPDYNTWRGPA